MEQRTVVGHVDIRNAGHLPARNVIWSLKFTLSEDDELNAFEIGGNETFYGNNTIPPGTIMRQGTFPITLTPNQIGYIYVWGRVYYDDGFRMRRQTNFCHRYNLVMLRMMEDGRGILAQYGRYHEYGNDAD